MKIVFLILFNCMLNAMQEASSIEITQGWHFHQTKPAKKAQLKRYLNVLIEKSDGDIDPRLLALSWIESRMRTNITRGDRGRACGIYQIHARYSYPYFRRKRGFNGWVERLNRRSISSECSKLESLTYSVDTMQKLLSKMDDKGLHPCHHNSGFYGKCNTWYKDRLDYWTSYFYLAKTICTQR